MQKSYIAPQIIIFKIEGSSLLNNYSLDSQGNVKSFKIDDEEDFDDEKYDIL